jgi:hypothetical protein
MTRQGCCLCEGLAEKLRALDPPLAIELIDVDGDPALGKEVVRFFVGTPNEYHAG